VAAETDRPAAVGPGSVAVAAETDRPAAVSPESVAVAAETDRPAAVDAGSVPVAGVADRPGSSARRTPGELAHSVVPIAAGYLLAHYYSLLVIEGQRTLALLADPLGTGANWLGTAGWEPHTGLVTPDTVAALQITVILVGHLIGTLLAHDRALYLFPRARAVGGQLPLLLLMVGYTVAGLLLLYAG
jgi:hypothetical protein